VFLFIFVTVVELPAYLFLALWFGGQLLSAFGTIGAQLDCHTWQRAARFIDDPSGDPAAGTLSGRWKRNRQNKQDDDGSAQHGKLPLKRGTDQKPCLHRGGEKVNMCGQTAVRTHITRAKTRHGAEKSGGPRHSCTDVRASPRSMVLVRLLHEVNAQARPDACVAFREVWEISVWVYVGNPVCRSGSRSGPRQVLCVPLYGRSTWQSRSQRLAPGSPS